MIAAKPLPRQNPKAYRPRRKPVTIATGFVYDDGLVFCVDTKVSTNIKTNQSKLLWYTTEDRRFCMSIAMAAEDLIFAKAAADCCWEFVSKLDMDTSTMTMVHKAAEFALGEFYREHIFTHPDRTPGAIFFELLLGLWLRGETRLLVSHETVLERVEEYECVGSGAYLAKYLVRQYRDANTGPATLEDAALMATVAVESAIEYDEHCGGEAEILIFRNSGEISNSYSTAVYPSPRFVKDLQREMWRMLHDVSQVRGDQDVESIPFLEAYFDRVRALNASHSWIQESMRGVRKKIWFPESGD
jgi:hypothetical protein